MAKILCWDLEILKPVSSAAGGWEAARRGDCGISALVISDSQTERFHIYDQHDLDAAVDHLDEADLLVGFNTKSFDTEVVYGCTGRMPRAVQYDILDEIWRALPIRTKGWKLDQVAERTLKLGKSGNGEFATALAAKGHWGKLFDYCLNDVHLTKMLFNHIIDMGHVIGPNEEKLILTPPRYEEYA